MIPVITIDGPGGVGKGTMACRIAQALNWHILDSGALYRAVAWLALQQGIAEEQALLSLVAQLSVRFEVQADSSVTVWHEQHNITPHLRDETCAAMASTIAQSADLRAALIPLQQRFLQQPGLVTDGRDMGTVIFPQAQLKFFLTADPRIRAERRFQQLKQTDKHVSLEQLLNQLEERDLRDASRAVAPLKPASDAVVIDTTSLNVEQVYHRMLRVISKVLEIEPIGW